MQTTVAPIPPQPGLDASRAPALLLGLIGTGIERSLTPAMHEREAACHGLRVHYQLIDLARWRADARELPGLLRAARLMGFAGLNVTHPFKEAIVPLLDDLAPAARRIGAVNTVIFDAEGRAVGHNTDASGWAWGLRSQLPRADLTHVVLLGAGGAGRAIADALLELGVGALDICDRDAARARSLAEHLQGRGARVRAVGDAAAALGSATGLVHATPTGMPQYPGIPVAPHLLHPGLWVAEAVYVPLQTDLVRAARARGCRVVDGGTMAVGQALGAFRLFTGREPDAQRMRSVFEQLVAARDGH
ncbi:MAG TPA: shikimate dehydrogenase [Burkholderiaceae bacterium]|nr:shikimate dehydrogenase [Burkholderiaceae bacterium]